MLAKCLYIPHLLLSFITACLIRRNLRKMKSRNMNRLRRTAAHSSDTYILS